MVTAYFWERETGCRTVLKQEPVYVKQGMSVCMLSVTVVWNINSGFKFCLLEDSMLFEHFIEKSYYFWDLKKGLEQS